MGIEAFVLVISTLPVITPQPPSAQPVHEIVNPVGPQVPSMAPALSPSGRSSGTTPPSARPATTQPPRKPATTVPGPHTR